MQIAISLILFIFALELFFRIAYLTRHGIFFKPVKKIPLKKLYINSHPYLPYKYKEDFKVDNYSEAASYPLHKGDILYGKPKLNNYGFIDSNFNTDKPPGLLRIACLGGSTTANMVTQGQTDYTYPDCLEMLLRQKYPGLEIEVMNFGMGGWTSAEILINFELTVLDFNPDIVLLYHGFNDLEPSITPGFKSDYSHARRNMAVKFSNYKIANLLPNIPFLHSYEYVKTRLLGTGNIRNDLFTLIRTSEPDLNLPFQGISTEKRNISSLINICRGNKINTILSSFVYFDFMQGKDAKANKYFEGVRLENRMSKELSAEFNAPFVDIFNLMPKEERYFVDTVHFSPEGMKKMAELFLPEIKKLIDARYVRGDKG